MHRDTELQLTASCVELVKANRPLSGNDEVLIPVDEYTDADRFMREQRDLLGRTLIVAAHASQLAAPGDFLTLDLMDTPVLLTRDSDGKARAFLNVCRHRGATVELRPQGNTKRFVCPYHAWTYDTRGTLVTARHAEGFPSLERESTQLRELACRERGGFIWVCPRADTAEAALTAFQSTAADAFFTELEGLGIGDYTIFDSEHRIWNANWKILVDGGLESYHFRVAHRNTVAPFFADTITPYAFFGDHIRTVLPRAGIVDYAQRPRSEWSIRECTHLLYSLFPNASVLVQEGHADLIRMMPLAIDRTLVDIITLVPSPGAAGFSEKARNYWSANHAFTKKTLHEDFEIAEQIQRGVNTGANTHFRFARFEGALSQWHSIVDAKLEAGNT
ncbi:aromatic ring-hydroxylating oxygenase subunit alpha [Sinimarinibacterium sp. CAU 1509]|uniref:aromatic ring-hydroxylating oxygenase subunit alpha n=1 Tax=Sinimarinibacterium sp. CAU 1509 TaxID=2562283 RepID=UPI00146EE588|nr:SRPBCC family protein [Sinimarinibacterium sp. CAU 1509]